MEMCLLWNASKTLFEKEVGRILSWLPFKAKDWNKDNPNKRKDNRILNPKVKIPHGMKSNVARWTKHCPRLCQQTDKGGKGRKTFDGRVCYACGYEKKDKTTS